MEEYCMSRVVGQRLLIDVHTVLRKTGVDLYHDPEMLCRIGCGMLTNDPVALLIDEAKELVGHGWYQRGATMSDAPEVIDCSSFIKYIFGRIGWWMPRHSITQRDHTIEISSWESRAGDMMFLMNRHGRNYYYDYDQATCVGHVALIVGDGTIIHAHGRVGCTAVMHEACYRFYHEQRVVGIGRVGLPLYGMTIEIPKNSAIESIDEVIALLLQKI